MANIVYDMIQPQLLLDYVRAYDNEVLRNVFTLDTLLPNRNIEDLEYRVRQGTLTDTDAAEYRAFDTPSTMTGRAGLTRLRGELAPVSRQIPLGEEEMLRLRALERGWSGSNNTPYEPLLQAIYDDSEKMVRSVQARIEMARGEALTTGKVVLSENGLTLTADFGMPSGNKVTAANLWTDVVNSKPLTDLLTWQDQYAVLNGTRPGKILMSQTRLSNMYLNDELRKVMQGSMATEPNRLNLEEVTNVFASFGLPPIYLYDTKVRVNGVSTAVLDPTKVLLLPEDGEPLGHTFYGITAEAIKLRSKGMISQEAMPGIVATIMEEEHPVQTFTNACAIALPVIPNPQLIIVATVA